MKNSNDIRLVAFDLDGTLLDPNRESDISPQVKLLVAAARQRGILVTLASGRPESYVLQRAQELNLDTPLISAHGSIVIDPVTDTILRESYLPADFLVRLNEIADQSDLEIGVYTRNKNLQLQVHLNRASKEPEFYRHLLGRDLILLEPGEQFPDSQHVLKFVVMTGETDAESQWQEWCGPTVSVCRSHHTLIEVTALGVSKGNALGWLAAHLGLTADQVLAVGDQDNDIPMFRFAKYSAAMGNAPEWVKQEASWVAPHYDDDGAAAALIHFLPELGQ
jgi:Cof subfamily protein (haloacid dehalogenase superfamily)